MLMQIRYNIINFFLIFKCKNMFQEKFSSLINVIEKCVKDIKMKLFSYLF